MTLAAFASQNDETDMFPLARIDAQDVPYVLPLRKFLETNGVRVLVNENPNKDPLYHIVVGEAGFVKDILSREHTPGAKILAIVVGFVPKYLDMGDSDAKVYLANAVPLSGTDAHDIFEFFFIGATSVFDGRSPSTQQSILLDSLGPEDEEHHGSAARIEHIITDVYGRRNSGEVFRPVKREKSRRRPRPHGLFKGVLFIVAIAMISVLWYGLSVGIGAAAVVAAARSLEQGEERSTGWKLAAARYWTNQSKFVLSAWSFPLSLAGFDESLRGQERLVSFLSDAERATSGMQTVARVAGRVATGLLNQVDLTSIGTTSASDIGELRMSVLETQNTLGLAQAQLSLLLADRTFPFSLPQIANRGRRITGMLSALRSRTANIDNLLSLFLHMSGFDGPRTYLIFFQNSLELRPTGGFIGSVAVTTFMDGRLTNLDIQDVYTFDGQLKGHVDPPMPIREILPSEHWYLRDSNWDPDFFASATRAAWFYEKETGSVVDGVFAINVPFVVKLLASTGPIDLPDYDDRITADNFYGKALYYTQQDFFPGSTQKKDFLGSLARALIEKTTAGKGVNTTRLFSAITTSLEAHDILFMFDERDIQTMVEHFGWAGRVPSGAGCAGGAAACRFDHLAIVEANLGVNKGSYFIKRAVNRDVTIDAEGLIHEKAILTLTNTSGGASPVPYRTYIRFFVPQGYSAGEVTLNGTLMRARTKEQKQPSFPYVEQIQGELGVALDVAPNSEARIAFAYDLRDPLVFGTSGALLELFDQKQPGVEGTAEHVTIQYPFTWTAGMEEVAAMADDDFIAKEGKLEYNTILTRDVLTRIRLTR